MIDLYYWPTPNGHKITMALEETGLRYRIVPVNIIANKQFDPAFLKIAPNNRMPAIVDHEPDDGGGALSIFESGAILQYFARKSGKLDASNPRERIAVTEWLFWQVGGLGPMIGQLGHFVRFATEQVPYGIDRYSREADRLLGVLDRRLAGRAYVAGGEYTIADCAIYPWVKSAGEFGRDLAAFAEVSRYQKTIAERPATIRAYAQADQVEAA